MFELGNNLRDARLQRRVDLMVAEQDTKIRSKYLSALEAEDFEVLPGPVFVRGFLRTYASYLGLDPQMFIDEYNARFGRFEEVEDHASPALGRPGLAQMRADRGRRTMRVVFVVALVTLALLVWLGLRTEDSAVTDRAERRPAQAGSNEVTRAEREAAAQRPGAALDDAVAVASEAPAIDQGAGAPAVPETTDGSADGDANGVPRAQ